MPTEHATMSTADYYVLGMYFIVMLAIGFYFMNRMRSMRDFFGGGGKIPWWLSGVSFFMTSFSAFAFVAFSEMAYTDGVVSLSLWWIAIPAILIPGWFFAARWRRVATTSPVEYLEQRYSPFLRQLMPWFTLPHKIIDDGLKLFVIGTFIHATLGLPLWICIISSGVIVLAYSFLGGLWAVMITDFVQSVIMMVAVVVLIPMTYVKLQGGWDGFVADMPDRFFALTSENYGWTLLFMFMVQQLLSYGASWSYVQRFYSVETDADARKVCYVVAFLNLVVPPLLFFPAMAARQFMPNIENTSEVYPMVCVAVLPIGMIGMITAAMFAATMSMISSDYNSLASVLTNDIYKRLFNPNAGRRHLVMIGRIMTLVVGIISIGIGLTILVAAQSEKLFDFMVKLFAIFMAPVALPMILGLLTPRVSNGGAICGLVVGITSGLIVWVLGFEAVSALMFGDPVEIRPWLRILLSVVMSSIGIIAGTLLMPSGRIERERIEEFFRAMHARDRWEEEPEEETQEGIIAPPKEAVSPATVIGVSVIALGVVMGSVVLITVDPLAEGAVSLWVALSMLILGALFWSYDILQKRRLRERRGPAVD